MVAPGRAARRRNIREVALWIAASGALLLAAIAARAAWRVNGDVSWLLELAQRTLDGAVPYRDFLEVNPPASILIYMPAVMLARLTGASPERMTDGLVFLAASCSILLCAAILVRPRLAGGRQAQAATMGVAAILALLILPFNSFAQREHIVVLAMLPIQAMFAARANGAGPRAIHIVLAGIGAGIAFSIKPIFALGLVGPMAYLVQRIGWREALRQPETCLAGFIAVIYGFGVVLLAPDFTTRVLPLVMTIYLPARLPVFDLLCHPTVLVWLGFCCAFCHLRRSIGKDVVGDVLILASAGFEAVFFMQGKGFVYHAYPAVALAGLACGSALSIAALDGPRGLARRHALDLALIASLVVSAGNIFSQRENNEPAPAPGLRKAIAAVSPRPRVLALTGRMPLSLVFARDIGGAWVASEEFPWVTIYAAAIVARPEQDPRFASEIRAEQDIYARDIDRQHPDVVLADGNYWPKWIDESTALARALDAYQKVGRYDGVTLWKRNVAPSAANAEFGEARTP